MARPTGRPFKVGATEEDVTADAKITPLPYLRWKKDAFGKAFLQQRFQIETAKAVFELWRQPPTVEATEAD